MKKNAGKQKETNPERRAPLTEAAETALKNYEQAVRTGLRLQEEAARWWTGALSRVSSPGDWEKRAAEYTALANGVLPLAQKRMEEMLVILEKNGRTGSELMKKAMDALQAPVLVESQGKWMDFWTSAMGAARSNTEAVSTLGGHAIDAWTSYLRRSAETMEARTDKAAA